MESKPIKICSNLEVLRDYVRGKHRLCEKQKVEDHLARCEPCAEIMDLIEFRWTSTLIPRSPIVPASPPMELDGLLDQLRGLPDQLN